MFAVAFQINVLPSADCGLMPYNKKAEGTASSKKIKME